MVLSPVISRIYLIGLMGAGKSTVGKLLARSLNWSFLDLDREIEALAGKTISAIFQEESETGFRDYEEQVLKKTVTRNQCVIACGGGVISSLENIRFLKNETTVWLDLSAAEAAARLEYSEDRPLLGECKDTLQELNEILSARQAAYAETARLRVASDKFPPEIIACNIVKELEKMDV